MKGLVLAGGTATRLFPLTIVTNKHLLPIYDRPMIYYPLDTLAGMGIREVMVIVGGKSVGDIVELLGDGRHFGLDLTYRYQRGALGHRARDRARPGLHRRRRLLRRARRQHPARPRPRGHGAQPSTRAPGAPARSCTACPDPERFGVAELDEAGNVVGFEEKPTQPKSDLIPIGVYFLRPDAFDVIETLAPSGRGEFEITDVLNHYIPERRPVHPGLRGPLGRRGHRDLAPAGRRARRGRRRGRAASPRRPPTRTTRSDDRPHRPRRRTCWSPAAPGSSAASSSAGSSAAATARGSPSSTSSPTPATGRTSPRSNRTTGAGRALRVRPGRHRRPRGRSGRSSRRPTRSSTSPPRPTSTARSSTPRRSCGRA